MPITNLILCVRENKNGFPFLLHSKLKFTVQLKRRKLHVTVAIKRCFT